VSKLTFEIEETDKKLVLEAERLQRQEWSRNFLLLIVVLNRCSQVERRLRPAQRQHNPEHPRTQARARSPAVLFLRR
jgi:hypothetical protein